MNLIDKHIVESEQVEAEVWKLLSEINDPEIPVISIVDLGIVRAVTCDKAGEALPKIIVTITPTYSGCPAMDVITMAIRMKLLEHGFTNSHIQSVLSPAWTTDWMSNEGKEKLAAFGIAPPNPSQSVCTTELFQRDEVVQCPLCKSYHTTMISRFGSTACKALYKCDECMEPFDYFKCH